jgi:hypothetical protein
MINSKVYQTREREGSITTVLNKAFLVPDSCRATEGNGNSISSDITDDTIEKRLEQHLFQLFLDNLAVVLDFLILQDKHNIMYIVI